ncbi:MAG TPA: acetyl-CoA carboxylase biotin carboxyl carrier protein subunit [Bacteroidales bacterium]|nr:acetyl-CoA carboxylase biotin carboxyl carrier protein subunit [Bacteroidales bacterium]
MMETKKNSKTKEKYDELCINGKVYKTILTEKFKNRKKWKAKNDKYVYAFIPGKIVKFCVKPNQRVKERDKLFILEAMKMRNHVLSPVEGTVKEIKVKVGDFVEKQQLILMIE